MTHLEAIRDLASLIGECIRRMGASYGESDVWRRDITRAVKIMEWAGSYCGDRLVTPSRPCERENDPTPWCNYCGARTKKECDCGPLADND